MNSLTAGRRTLLLALAGALGLGVLVVVVTAAVVIWHVTEWSSGAIDKATNATVAAVAPLRADAARVITDAAEAATSTTAVVAMAKEEAARALEEAKASLVTTRGQVSQAMIEPEAAIRRLADAAVVDASRSLVTAAATVAPIIAGHGDADAATASLNVQTSRDPQTWPRDLALKQTHFREVGAVAEYGYVSTGREFELTNLREQLVEIGYIEHIIAQAEGSLEAVYRGERQLLLSVTSRDGHQHVDVREAPLAVPAPSAP